ncbi:MAG: tyrosine--tRNA ligase [Aaplasma endosymbiont of Hyalomma asiaticum]
MFPEYTGFESEFLATLAARGYLQQLTDAKALDDAMSSGEVVAYIGFDCTAVSLHIGSLMQMMVLRYLQKAGHKPIVLLGGATTKIGDPSGREKSRTILSEDKVVSNTEGILRAIRKFLPEESGVLVVNNAEWLDGYRYLDFLRDVGSKFSVNVMLGLESVKSRLSRDQQLSFLEFNYVLLQSYDFVELYKRHGCILQIGGSDQWGNIVSGIDLARRMGCPQLYGITTPLLLNSSGAKMGKTADGAVWLDETLYSPYEYWQYFRNVSDQDVGRFLRLFTELPIDEIKRLEVLRGEELNEAKKVLATEATSLCHGISAALQSARQAQKVFEHGDDSELRSIELSRKYVVKGMTVARLLSALGVESSVSAGRRLIRGKGCRVNGEIVDDEYKELRCEDFDSNGGYVTVFCGKKRRFKVILGD